MLNSRALNKTNLRSTIIFKKYWYLRGRLDVQMMSRAVAAVYEHRVILEELAVALILALTW